MRNGTKATCTFPLTQDNAIKFISLWQKTRGVSKVAELLDITVQRAQSIAYELRKKGVKLKKMPYTGGISSLNIEALKVLADESLAVV